MRAGAGRADAGAAGGRRGARTPEGGGPTGCRRRVAPLIHERLRPDAPAPPPCPCPCPRADRQGGLAEHRRQRAHPRRPARYLRLSLDREGKTAIDRQEADCRAWAERNGLTVRKVHIDRGRSGYKNVSRKGFDAAITAATAGVVGVLIVWKLDRLSRKGIGEVGKALDDIGRVGGRLVSVMDGLDTRNDSARVTIAMLAELARNESRNLGMRVGNAKRYLRQRGQGIGGQPPYGLLVDPEAKKLVHEPRDRRLRPPDRRRGAVREGPGPHRPAAERARGGVRSWRRVELVQRHATPPLTGLRRSHAADRV